MKLFVIVLCLFAERYFVHAISHHRFLWFEHFSKRFDAEWIASWKWNNPYILLFIPVLSVTVGVSLVLYFMSDIAFGFSGFILNLFIFYYCLGPENPFYPVKGEASSTHSTEEAGQYLVNVNSQLFSVIFWYGVAGPVGLVFYRLLSVSKRYSKVKHQAQTVTDILEWIPAKLTALLYLLVGNFQAGIQSFSKLLLSHPTQNLQVLKTCGLLAVERNGDEQCLMPKAEVLVEHAVIALLVLLAILTIVAWA